MDSAKLLHQLCHDVLSDADIRAIAKARGFSTKEISSRSLLANYYLSSIGVKKVLKGLTSAEINLLHLLAFLNIPINIEVFERLYRSNYIKNKLWRETFTQRHGDTLRAVRKNLVRKGILLMSEKGAEGVTKMERWRFYFPAEFAPYLPQPFTTTLKAQTRPDSHHDIVRNKLLALIDKAETPGKRHPDHKLGIKKELLRLGELPLTMQGIKKWREYNWKIAMPKQPIDQNQQVDSVGPQVAVLNTLTYALGQLPDGVWVSAENIAPILKTFTNQTHDVTALCTHSWQWGYLARSIVKGIPCYRLADTTATTPIDPASYLSTQDGKNVQIDLLHIPIEALETLNLLARFKIKDGQLVATPHLSRLGEVLHRMMGNPQLSWLLDNVAAFRETQKVIKQRWGKQIVHTNLLIAHVSDFTLHAKLEHVLKASEVVLLDDGFIAFPRKLLPKIERIVKKEGHVIKEGRL